MRPILHSEVWFTSVKERRSSERQRIKLKNVVERDMRIAAVRDDRENRTIQRRRCLVADSQKLDKG